MKTVIDLETRRFCGAQSKPHPETLVEIKKGVPAGLEDLTRHGPRRCRHLLSY